MSLLDKLLSTPANKFTEMKTDTFHSKRLEKIIGEGNITIREIPYKRLNDLISKQFDKKGNFDFNLSARAKAIMTAEGVTDPSLKDEKLLSYFGAASPADLAEILFGNEITAISDGILTLSGYITDEETAEETDEEIKNC